MQGITSEEETIGVDEEVRSATGRGRRLRWRPRLVLLGVIGAIAMTAEAGVIIWSAILLHDHLSASLRIAALAGFFFAGMQASGRLVGDRLLGRHSRVLLIRGGTAIAALGTLVIVTASATAVSRFGMLTYAGLQFSPAVIGWSADHIGLSRPLALLVPAFLLATAFVGFSAPGTNPEEPVQ